MNIYHKPPSQQLEDKIQELKSEHDDCCYDDLQFEPQQELCALYAATVKDLDDLLCDANNRQLIAYWKSGDTLKGWEYLTTIMTKYLEPQVREHFDRTPIDRGDEIDAAYERLRDRELMA